MIVLKKILLIILVLAIIYFSLGFIASVVLIVMEFNSHQMSREIGGDFDSWIIYLGLGLFSIFLGLIIMSLGAGFYHLRKNIRNLL